MTGRVICSMSRWIGFLLILFSSAGMGFAKAGELQRHIEDLQELQHLFQMFQSELQYGKIPLGELFGQLSRKTSSKYEAWLEDMRKQMNLRGEYTFLEIWEGGIEKHLTGGTFAKKELEELKAVGRSLEYPEQIELYLSRLAYEIQQLREEAVTKKKLYRSLGVMGGIFLVVVLF